MNKLIIVVDMLNGFANKGVLASNEVKKIIPFIEKYLAINKQTDNLFVCDAHNIDDIEMEIYPPHCLINTEESEIVKELKPFAKKILFKNSTNAFHNIKKDNNLLKYDVYEIVGCCTDICVLQLAITLKTYFNEKKINKKVSVLSNLCATFDNPNHPAIKFHDYALKIMKLAGIDIK